MDEKRWFREIELDDLSSRYAEDLGTWSIGSLEGVSIHLRAIETQIVRPAEVSTRK